MKRDWAGLFKVVGFIYLILLVGVVLTKLSCAAGCGVGTLATVIATLEWLMIPVAPFVLFIYLPFIPIFIVIYIIMAFSHLSETIIGK